MKKNKPIFDGFDYGELCEAWGLNEPEPVNFRDECFEIIKNTDYAILETVGSWEEYKLRKHINTLFDDFDNNLEPGDAAKEACEQIREYLKALNNHCINCYSPLYEGIMNMEDDFSMLHAFRCLLRHLWT